MANRTLSREDVSQIVPSEPGRPLRIIYLQDSEDQAVWRSTAFLLRVRRIKGLHGLPAAGGSRGTAAKRGRRGGRRGYAVGVLEVILADFP